MSTRRRYRPWFRDVPLDADEVTLVLDHCEALRQAGHSQFLVDLSKSRESREFVDYAKKWLEAKEERERKGEQPAIFKGGRFTFGGVEFERPTPTDKFPKRDR